MTENLYKEEKLREFLLTDLSEPEREQIEGRVVADEDFAAQLFVIEDELIEAWLRRELSPKLQQRFEAAYLTHPRRRERVLAMKGVLAAVNAEAVVKDNEAPSLWASLLAFFRFQSALASYAVAAAVLFVLSFGALLLFSRLGPTQNGQLAQQTPVPIRPEATASVLPLSSSDSPPAPTPATSPVPRTSPSPLLETPPAGPTLATIILRPTLVRDPAAANRIIVAPSVKQVRLQLNLDRNDYRSYAVRITTVEGQLVWQRGSVKRQATNAGTSLAVSLPVRLLPTDDYLVEVSGISDAGAPESLTSYFFSVTRK